MIKTKISTIHCIAFCRDCDWQEVLYLIAVKKGREHNKKTGHTVDIERGQHWRYKSNPNKEDE